MRSFTDLAKDYQFSPVRSADGELAGYLHLDAKATKAALSSRQFHHFDDGDNGWFDLEIEDHRGSRILLHNALTQSEVMPGSASGRSVGSYTSEIFPNVVVFGTENLRNDQTLHQMAFEFEGAENFFVYNTIEWHSFYRQENKLGVLKSIRKESWKPPRGMRTRNHLDDPYDIYVIHKPRRYIDITLEDMRIRVLHSRYQRGGGWTGHEIRVTPIVSVIFEKPVSVDEAVNRIWRIKGFFDQLSLCDLRFKAISFSKFKKGWPRAEVYLPNEHRKTAKRLLDVHPTNVPFSTWAERKKFQACLLRWLAHSEERRFFRSALRLSLVRLQTEVDPTLITLLMAGVESLAGLGGRSGISPETVKKMADAVHRIDPTIDYASIKGLLGSLGRTSPKQRLRKIADRSFVSAVGRDIEDFTSSSVKLRNQIAHGRELDQFERAAAGDLTQALTYLCVAYDLQTSGIPPREEDTEKRGFLALSRMAWAWQGYKMALAKEVSLDG